MLLESFWLLKWKQHADALHLNAAATAPQLKGNTQNKNDAEISSSMAVAVTQHLRTSAMAAVATILPSPLELRRAHGSAVST